MTKIFVIDDSELIRRQIREDLIMRGYKVIEASNGGEAIKKYPRERPFALIICDINMPDMMGLDVCEEILNMEKGTPPPIVMLTSETTADLKSRAVKLGIKAWMIKPFNTNLFFQAIKRLVKGP